jgi:hypothetical protein
MSIRWKIRLLVFTWLFAIPAFATDGYFSIGYGVKQVGRAVQESRLRRIVWRLQLIPRAWFLSGIVSILG